MPDAGRQIREVRVPRNVELTPLKNKSEQKRKKLKELENQRKRYETRDE